MTHSFDLIEKPWVPALMPRGPDLLSLRQVFEQAKEITDFYGLNGTTTVSLIRVLEAILFDAHRVSGDMEWWKKTWDSGNFDDTVLGYLDEYSERFDLFHPDYPFYQVAGLEPVSDGGFKPIGILMPGVSAGNNTPLFSSLIDNDLPDLAPAEAALRLIEIQGWDTAGIKTGALGDPEVKSGKTSGNLTGYLGQLGAVVPLGRNLFETLMLNYPLDSKDIEGDLPLWRRSVSEKWEKRQPRGILEALTWSSRRVRMIPNEAKSGFTSAVVSSGDRTEFVPDFEPQTVWRIDKKAPNGRRSLRHQSGQAPWRGIPALTTIGASEGGKDTSIGLSTINKLRHEKFLDEDYPLDVLLVGVSYGTMSAIIEDVITERLPLPLRGLVQNDSEVHEEMTKVAEASESLVKALNSLDANLRRAQKAEPIPWDKGQRVGDRFSFTIGPSIIALLQNMRDPKQDLDDLVLAWQLQAYSLARSVGDPLLDSAISKAGSSEAMDDIIQARIYCYGALKNALPEAHEHRKAQERSNND
ncbi:MAG: type I-E CRISPR-associated protein Cse1/CasA [Actinomycetaceae bacterium]|nr:type I-E CRISPR-associated protein Cse1/CasA [Actinomycetaceae bacterium]